MRFRPGLRFNRHEVSLIKTNGRSGRQLGVAYPDDSDRRARVMQHWGINNQSPRRPELNTVNIPLPRRAQAILSYRLPAHERDLVNRQQQPLVQSRRDLSAGVKERVHVDTDTAMAVESAARSGAAPHSTPSHRPTKPR